MILKNNKNISPVKAIVFDCYRTLFTNRDQDWQQSFANIIEDQQLSIETSNLWKKWKRYENQFRLERTSLKNPRLSPRFRSYEEAWTECFEKVFEDEGIKGDAQKAGKHCIKHLASRPIFGDTIPALESLDGTIQLGVFSNADEAFLLPIIDRLDVSFDAVSCSESARIYKPAKGAFEHILKLLNVSAECSWYVGDHLYDDVLGANSVGMTTVWINRTRSKVKKYNVAPDIEITDLRELGKLVNKRS